MKEKNDSNQKICAFYVSDYHFEMISLPYIIERLNEERKVVILTENDLEKSIKILMSNMILKQEKKNKILEIDWNKNDINKIEKIKNENTDNKITIFIKGKQEYIFNMHEKLKEVLKTNDSIEIVDCYNVEEIENKMETIVKKYENVLNTAGKKEIQKI